MTEKSARKKEADILNKLSDEFENLAPFERQMVMRALAELKDSGKSQTLNNLWEKDFFEKPVSISEFLENDYYLGKIVAEMYPIIKKELLHIFREFTTVQEVILAGSIGWGKTFLSAVGLTYLVYMLSCLRDPHKYYKIAKGSTIVIGVYSVSKTQAYDSSYSKVKLFVDESPYFQRKFKRDALIKSRLNFPRNIRVIAGSTELHTVGLDMFGFLLDEANFFNKKGKNTDGDALALSIYKNAKTRIKSRFLTVGGGFPGMIFLVSSKRTHKAFLEEHIASVKDEIDAGTVHLMEYNQWQVKPHNFKLKKFKVELGDRVFPSRILGDKDEPRLNTDIIEIPGEYLTEFETDVDQALRDIAGVATYGISPLIYNKQLIHNCITNELAHPFIRTSITLDDTCDIGLDHYFIPECLFNIKRSRYTVRNNPMSPRFVHIDLGLTGDSAGLSCVHAASFSRLNRERGDGTYYLDMCPCLVTDFMLKILPPKAKGSEIDISKIRSFIISLKDLGLPILKVTADGYQSRDFMQIMRKLGFESNVYSVDRTDEPYLYLRQSIMETRLSFYKYTPVINELSDLERDIDKRKVDHPKTSSITGKPGSKDVADSLCGAVSQCILDPRSMEWISEKRDTGSSYGLDDITANSKDVDWDAVDKECARNI